MSISYFLCQQSRSLISQATTLVNITRDFPFKKYKSEVSHHSRSRFPLTLTFRNNTPREGVEKICKIKNNRQKTVRPSIRFPLGRLIHETTLRASGNAFRHAILANELSYTPDESGTTGFHLCLSLMRLDIHVAHGVASFTGTSFPENFIRRETKRNYSKHGIGGGQTRCVFPRWQSEVMPLQRARRLPSSSEQERGEAEDGTAPTPVMEKQNSSMTQLHQTSRPLSSTEQATRCRERQ